MTTTTNIKLDTPSHGSNVDTWDSSPINNNSGILDAVFGSITAKSLTNANVTLTTTEGRVSILRFSGTLSGNVIITLPVAGIIKSWICENNTLGAFVVTVSGGSGNVVGLPPGSCQVYWDGTNVSFINLDKIGAYWDYAGSDTPIWVTACTIPPYLKCNGSSFSAVTYPILNQILGTTTLPDTRGRARFALNEGTNRITAGGSGIDGDTRAAAGGTQEKAILQANLPIVNFNISGITLSNPPHNHSGAYAAVATAAGPGASALSLTDFNARNTGDTTTNISVATQGVAASGGSATNVAVMNPAYIGGITLIRAA